MFGAFGYGQGYFGQGPLGGTVPAAAPAVIPEDFVIAGAPVGTVYARSAVSTVIADRVPGSVRA